MDEQQPAERSPGPASAATTQPGAALLDEAEPSPANQADQPADV
ncbi:MAG TPA: hypothetical protein VGH96_20755 [Streptosporangiaceae bacterium]